MPTGSTVECCPFVNGEPNTCGTDCCLVNKICDTIKNICVPKIIASCKALAPNPVKIGQVGYLKSSVINGTGNYTYSWSGCQTISKNGAGGGVFDKGDGCYIDPSPSDFEVKDPNTGEITFKNSVFKKITLTVSDDAGNKSQPTFCYITLIRTNLEAECALTFLASAKPKPPHVKVGTPVDFVLKPTGGSGKYLFK